MKNIVEWLISVESMAALFYEGSAKAFLSDGELSRFLGHLAVDEKWHRHIMGIAAEYLKEGALESAILLDEGTQAKIETPFREGTAKLEDGTLTKRDVIECVAMTEFSEWNDVFQYVINSLKQSRKEFEPVAAKMQQHKRRIEKYLETLPDTDISLNLLRGLPPVWREHILLVEDFPPIRDFLAALLSTEGTVHTAADGKEGLTRVGGRYYDVIVSDIDMPVMDGIEFYRQSVQIEPRIGERFLFLAGDPSDEQVDFLKQNGLRHLVKPAPIREIATAVEDIMMQASRTVVRDY